MIITLIISYCYYYYNRFSIFRSCQEKAYDTLGIRTPVLSMYVSWLQKKIFQAKKFNRSLWSSYQTKS